MKYKELQPSFTGGEISPDLQGRVDFQAYSVSVAKMFNMFSRKQGGAYRRGGTYFVRETKSSGSVFLMPFEFSADQAYILEWGDYYIRFYYNNGIVLNSGTPYEVTTPFTAAEMREAKYIQSNDIVYIAHKNHKPCSLSRYGHTNWTLVDLAFDDGPYLEQKNNLTITPSARTGNGITLTASASFFLAGHVGTYVRLRHKTAEDSQKTVWGYAKITAVASGTSATADVIRKFGNTTASEYYREAAFSSIKGWPRAVRIMDERLTFANHTDNPSRIWFSKTGDYLNFTPDTGTYYDTDNTTIIHTSDALSDDSIVIAISDGKVNYIHWLEQGKDALVVGTSGSEFRLRPSGNNSAISPDGINVVRQTSRGSSTLQGEYVNSAVLFVSKTGKQVREFSYDYASDSYVTPDLIERATHFTDYDKLTAMAHQKEPHGIVWFIREDGTLLGLTYERENKVFAWHEHQLGGTNVEIESIAVIPSLDQSRYDLWLSVKRTINGSTKRYIEYMKSEKAEAQEDCFFVDCGLTYSGTATNTITGLSHLEGETVHILANGATHPTRVVTGGSITLNANYTKVQVGLNYRSVLQTLPLATKNAVMTDQGQNKRIVQVIVRIIESLGIKVGPSLDLLDELVFNNTVIMGQGVPLFTGDANIAFNGDYETTGQVFVVQDYPLPMNLTGVLLDGKVVD